MNYFNEEIVGMRVFKYIRCSHEKQARDGETLDAQNAILDDFIGVNKLKLVETFIDEAKTARKSYSSRKEFMRMIDAVKRQEVDLIIFTRLERWFRNVADYHAIQAILEQNHVAWKAVQENYDTTTANGRLYINIRMSVAQDEADRTSGRIKDVFQYKLNHGEIIYGSMPLGFAIADKKVVHDPSNIDIVLEMFAHFESTGSVRGTLLYIRNQCGFDISYRGLHRLLQNPSYKGTFQGRDNFCEPIIQPERWDHIQTLIKTNVRKRNTNHSYIFSGLVKCGECGRMMSPQTQVRHQKEHVYYRCFGKIVAGTCDTRSTTKESYIENYVLDHIQDSLKNYIGSFDAVAAAKKRNIVGEEARLRDKMKRLKELFLEGLIELSEYRSDVAEYESQLSELASLKDDRRDLAKLQEVMDMDFETAYMSLDKAEKCIFWKSFIDHIVLRANGEIDIIFL